MEYVHSDALVEASWLAAHLGDPNVRVIDATYHLPHGDRDAREEYGFRHIPGASFFELDVIADTSTDLPHMLPSAELFAETVGKMGVDNNTRVITYDSNGGFMAAARLWWMFRVFGHDNVAMLNGGLGRWGKEKLPLEHDMPAIAPKTFKATFRPQLVADLEMVREDLETRHAQIVDARSPKRFAGIDHEPRPTEKRGHIPGSVNMPFTQLMMPMNDFAMRPADELEEALAAYELDPERPIIATCGSGVTAAVLALALYLNGHPEVAVYDGSWAEWGNRSDVPIDTCAWGDDEQ